MPQALNKHALSSVIAALVLSMLILWAYAGVFENRLVAWDTEKFISLNPHIQNLTAKNLGWMLTEIYRDHWHPLTWLSHAVDYHFYGVQAWGHHASSLILHIANSLWFFALVRILLRGRSGKDCFFILFAAFSAGLLFALHPQHVESVAWEAERKDVLSLYFALPSLLAYVLYTRLASDSRAARYWYSFSLCCFALALTGKSMLVTLPAVLILLDAYPLRRFALPGMPALHTVTWKRLAWEKVPFFGLSLFVIVLTLVGQIHIGSVATLETAGYTERVWNTLHNIHLYLSKMLLPVGLINFYPLPVFETLQDYLVPLCVFLSITFICLYLWFKRQYYWLAGWLFFLITLSPVSGLVQSGHQAAADRYTYWPMLSLHLLTGLGLAVLWQRKSRVAAGLLSVCLFMALLFLTRQQVTVWHDELSLWQNAARSYPDNPQILLSIGAEHMRRAEYPQAIAYYHKGLAKQPLNLSGHNQLATVYAMAGQLHEAKQQYLYILAQADPSAEGLDTVYYNLALLQYRDREYTAARESVEQSLKHNPQREDARVLQKHLQAFESAK